MQPDENTRRCILSAEHGPRAGLIRLALGPDGTVLPDLLAKAGGRGAWIAVDRATLEAARTRGRLKAALGRALRTHEFSLPEDIGARIEAGLARLAMDRLGLENRAGALILGFDRILGAVQAGEVDCLIHAADAGEDGRRTLNAKLASFAPDAASISGPADREALSHALGRANVVHVAVRGLAPAGRLRAAFARWRDFTGTTAGERGPEVADVPLPQQTAAAAIQGRL